MKTPILILLVLFFLGCKKESNEPVLPKQTGPVSFNSIKRGTMNGSEGIAESNLVINNNADWQNLISQMDSQSNISSTFSETDIDFNEYTIIAVFYEVKNSYWLIEVTAINENEENLSVTIEDTPTTGSAISQPFHIVKIDKTTKPILFQ